MRKFLLGALLILAFLLCQLAFYIKSITPVAIGKPGSPYLFASMLLIGVTWFVSIFIFYRSLKAEEAKRRKIFEGEWYEWHRKMQVWDALYFCRVSDCVFKPQTGEFKATSRMAELYS